MDDSSPRSIAVIGAGLTGLAAAHRLIELTREAVRPVDVTVYETSDRCGGVMGTQRIGEYLIETGADSFITNKPWGVALCRRLGLENDLIPTDDRYRRSLILHRGKPVETPEGFNLLVPGRLWPMVTTPLLSPWGKLRMALDCVIPPRPVDGDESLASFVRRRLGREALERIVQPMVGGIYTSDPDTLSLAATLPRFLELERESGSLIRGALRQRRKLSREESQASGARYGLFTTPAGGVSQLLDALAARVQASATLRLGCAVVSLTPRSDPEHDRLGYRLTLADGAVQEADAVILALPAFRAADLIDGCHPDLAAALRGIEYASSAIVVSGHRLTDVAHPLDAFGLVIPHIERRRILAVSFLSRKFPGRAPEGKVILRTFIGGAMQPELLEQDDGALVETALSELQALLGVRGTPDFTVVARYHRGMPQYHVGHLDRVAEIERLAKETPGLHLAGNAYHGVGIPDSIHSGEQAAEQCLAAWLITSMRSNNCE